MSSNAEGPRGSNKEPTNGTVRRYVSSTVAPPLTLRCQDKDKEVDDDIDMTGDAPKEVCSVSTLTLSRPDQSQPRRR